ncbi:hypothetical protein P692DRAFT_20647111, partial [Suillus brevipes Sb2]
STSSTTGTLRTHVHVYHMDLYLAECERRGPVAWPILINEVQSRLDEGWTISQMRERLSQDPDCTIETLGVPPNPVCNNSLPAQSEAVLPDFSVDEMHQHIVRFIIADDQPINVVECPEFRQLLRLMHQDLKESDIPRRMKFRSLIIDAW